jgi:hypothetical protein
MKGVQGKNLFSIKRCPTCHPESIEIKETHRQGNVSKGKIIYPFTCRMVSTDYYAGREKKKIETQKSGTVSADYVYAFDELSIANIEVNGPRYCARPILEKFKAAGAGEPVFPPSAN